MKRTFIHLLQQVAFVSAVVGFFVLLSPVDILADEGAGRGRKIYDTIMLWINFGILVFVFMKFAKPALMKFLYGERDKVEKDLQAIEEDLNVSKKRVEEESKNLEGIDEYLQQIRADILEMGEKEKTRILEDAERNASQMIKDAENELALKLEEAKRTLNDRLVEKAVIMAREKLSKEFTDKDNDKQIDGFVGGLADVRHEEMRV